jgi:hypothetical protein
MRVSCNRQSLASQLFAASLFPYLAFLFFLTKSGKAPRLMLGGFYFLLAFVGATIPAGIYGEDGQQQQQQQTQLQEHKLALSSVHMRHVKYKSAGDTLSLCMRSMRSWAGVGR